MHAFRQHGFSDTSVLDLEADHAGPRATGRRLGAAAPQPVPGTLDDGYGCLVVNSGRLAPVHQDAVHRHFDALRTEEENRP